MYTTHALSFDCSVKVEAYSIKHSTYDSILFVTVEKNLKKAVFSLNKRDCLSVKFIGEVNSTGSCIVTTQVLPVTTIPTYLKSNHL